MKVLGAWPFPFILVTIKNISPLSTFSVFAVLPSRDFYVVVAIGANHEFEFKREFGFWKRIGESPEIAIGPVHAQHVVWVPVATRFRVAKDAHKFAIASFVVQLKANFSVVILLVFELQKLVQQIPPVVFGRGRRRFRLFCVDVGRNRSPGN